MAVEVVLWCIAILLATAPAAVAGARRTATTILVYAIALVVSTIALATVAWALVMDAGLAQTFPRAVRPPVEVRTELQLAFDLLGRRGLAQAAAIRKELAAAVPAFAVLAAGVPNTGVKLQPG